MSDGNDTLYTYTSDASSVLESFDEISGGITTLIEDIQALVDAASQLTLLEDVLAGLADELDALDGSAIGATSAMGEVATVSDEAAASISTLSAAMDEISAMTQAGAEAAAGLGEAMMAVADDTSTTTSSIDGLNSVIDQMSTTITEDTAVISALNEQIANLEGQLGILTGEEETASAGASGLADGLQAAMGPLMMIGTVAALAGGQLIGMGMSGQKGESLLSGMAGASQADIQMLQVSALQLGETMDQASAGFYEVESAGYSGAGAIQVFTEASKLAEGGQASAQDVMSGLTAIMHDYNASADDATQYTDYMAEAVLRGKQSMQDFSSSIGPLAAMGQTVGLSFDQVAAAEATLTQINPHVAQDTQQLKALFQTLSPTMGTTVDTAKKLGLAFDEQKYSSLDLLGKLQYLAQISGGEATEAFKKLTGGKMGFMAADALMKNSSDAFIGNLDAMKNSTGATEHAFASFEATVPAHLDKAGAALSILSTRIMDALGPKIIPIIDRITAAIGAMADGISQHGDIAMPVLAGLATMLGVILVTAVVGFVVSMGPVVGVIIGIAAAIGVVVAGIALLVSHWNQITSVIQSNPVLDAILHVLQQVGGYLASLFVPIWRELVTMWQTQLVPAFMQLWQEIQPLMPGLKLLGEILGGVVVIAIILVVAQISSLLSAFAGMLPGLIRVFGGIVQIISGAIQVIIGIFTFFSDLTHGNFSKLGADLAAIWQGVVVMFTGLWNVIAGLFQAATGFIGGLISGFATVIVGILQDMGIKGVNHVLDMINGIVRWFQQLPDMAGRYVFNMAEQVGAILLDLGPKALVWAEDMMNSFIQGIENKIGDIGSAISGIGDQIKKILGFSKPEEGPLSNADQWMPDFIALLEEGMNTNVSKIKNASLTLASTLSLSPPALSSSALTTGPASGSGNTQTTQYLAQMVSLLAQIVQLQQRQAGQAQTLTFNAASGGTISPQQLYQIMQSLSGYSYEGVQRGAL